MLSPQSFSHADLSSGEDRGPSTSEQARVSEGSLLIQARSMAREAGLSAYFARIAAIFVVALAIGFALSGLAMVPAPVVAQGTDPCPLTYCDFSCSNNEDAWYISGSGEGVWMIVHAKAVLTTGNGTGVHSALKWRETGSPDNYPKMKVVGHWKDQNGNPLTAEIRVNDNGTCYEGDDPDDRIRCHQNVKVGGGH